MQFLTQGSLFIFAQAKNGIVDIILSCEQTLTVMKFHEAGPTKAKCRDA